MKTINKIKIGSIMLGAMVIGGGAFAASWGPERDLYSWNSPADHVVFNSLVDNPTIGDERNFVRVRKAGTDDVLVDTLEVEPGDIIEVFVYYHNNASATYNDAAHNHSGFAFQTRLAMEGPEVVEAGKAAEIKGTISANNMQIYQNGELLDTQEIWDVAYLKSSDETVYLRYEDGSAVIHNEGTANGEYLSDSALWSEEGVYLEYLKDEKYWGVIPGCNEFAGYVTFNIKVDQPGFEIEAKVKKTGDTDYQDEVTVAPGDVVDLRLCYTNSGTTIQNDVTLKDELPDKLTPVSGSVSMTTTTGGTTKVQDGIFSVGLQVGSFSSGQSACAYYQAKAAEVDCGTTTVETSPWVYTNNGGKTDSVKINIKRTEGCDTPKTMPKTGPKEIAIIAMTIGLIAIGGGYYYYSFSKLRKKAAVRGISSREMHKKNVARTRALKKVAKTRKANAKKK